MFTEEKMPRIISVIAQKGGVGKTTATVHIASALANMGFKTLVIDWDTTQGNLTYATIGELDPKTQKGICHIIASGGSLDEVIYPTSNPNLSIIPTEKMNSRGNAYSIGTILTQLGSEGYSLLKELINESEQLINYNFVLIDNCPNLGMETVASLIASDYFIVPVQMKDFSITSIGQTFKTAMTVKKAYNKDLEPIGLFVSSTDNRIKQAKIALEELKVFCHETEIPLLKVTIPSVSKFDFLPRNQQTIFDVVSSKERGHKDYLDLTKEILAKMKSIEQSSTLKASNTSVGV
jgi:chromosome partitioning protein